MIFLISFDLVSLRESVVTDTFINAGSSKQFVEFECKILIPQVMRYSVF